MVDNTAPDGVRRIGNTSILGTEMGKLRSRAEVAPKDLVDDEVVYIDTIYLYLPWDGFRFTGQHFG